MQSFMYAKLDKSANKANSAPIKHITSLQQQAKQLAMNIESEIALNTKSLQSEVKYALTQIKEPSIKKDLMQIYKTLDSIHTAKLDKLIPYTSLEANQAIKANEVSKAK